MTDKPIRIDEPAPDALREAAEEVLKAARPYGPLTSFGAALVDLEATLAQPAPEPESGYALR
jgi:hypothetical protein